MSFLLCMWKSLSSPIPHNSHEGKMFYPVLMFFHALET